MNDITTRQQPIRFTKQQAIYLLGKYKLHATARSTLETLAWMLESVMHVDVEVRE